jgi:hypothetical protein
MKVGDLVEFDDDGVRLGIYGLIVSEHGQCTTGLIYKNVYFFGGGDNHFPPEGLRHIKQENLVVISESR